MKSFFLLLSFFVGSLALASSDSLYPIKVSSAQSMGASFNSPTTNITHLDRVSVAVNVLSGSPVGSFTLQGRVSFSTGQYAANTGPSTEWVDIPNSSQSAPASGATINWDLGYTAFSEVRAAYTRTSGTGTCDVWVAGKRSGS